MDAEKNKRLSDEYINIPQILAKSISNNINFGVSTLASCSTSGCQTACQFGCQTTCENYCQGCQSGCQTSENCYQGCSSCQNSCQSSCEKSSQSCTSTCEKTAQGCSTKCEIDVQCATCQYGCEYYCQLSCQLHCQTCQSGCQKAEGCHQCGTCEVCQSSCQTSCQNACERSCEVGCQVSNQGCGGACQSSCQTGCQVSPMGGCSNCELCLNECQTCLGSVQNGCEVACMSGCERPCEWSQTCDCQFCETCQLCQSCEANCESNGGGCQTACLSGGCQSICEIYAESGCKDACQDACQSGICMINSEAIWGGSGTVKPTATGNLTVISIGTDYIEVSLSVIPNATYYQIAYRLSSVSTATIIETNQLTVIITGLTPNTEYVVNYRGANKMGAGPFMPQGVTVKTRPIGVWEWYSNIAQGLPMGCLVCETAAEHTNGIKVIPAYEWRDFCNMINDVRRLKKLSSYYFTNPVDGAEFTAAVFNEAVSAIQDMNSAVSSVRVTSGSQILASSFLDIRDRLNECV